MNNEGDNNGRAVLTCPVCSYQKEEIIPADACLFFYTCEGCHATLRPLPGHCCVFCSYGSRRCPTAGENCCGD